MVLAQGRAPEAMLPTPRRCWLSKTSCRRSWSSLSNQKTTQYRSRTEGPPAGAIILKRRRSAAGGLETVPVWFDRRGLACMAIQTSWKTSRFRDSCLPGDRAFTANARCNRWVPVAAKVIHIERVPRAAPQLGGRGGFSRFRSVVARFTVFSPKSEWRETTTTLRYPVIPVTPDESLCIRPPSGSK